MELSLFPSLDFLAFALVSLLVCGAIHLWLRRRADRGLPGLAWLLAALVILATWIHSGTEEAREKEQVQRLLEGYGRLFATSLESMGHYRLPSNAASDDPLYLQLIELEKRWLAAAPRVTDVYTMRRGPKGEKAFVVDSETDYDRDGVYDGEKEKRTVIGEVYPEEDEGQDIAFNGHANFDPEPVTDRWGTWVSANVPLLDPAGRIEAIVGVDYDAEMFLSAAANGRRKALAYMGILQAMLLAGCALVAQSRSQTRERATAAERLARSEEQFRRFMDNSSAVAFVKDAEGRHLYANRALECLVGRPANEIIGRTNAEIWPDRGRDALEPADRQVLEEESHVESVERVPDREGRMRTWSVSKFMLRDAEGQVQIGGVAIDITRQIELEEQMLQAQKMETVGKLAAGVAHDFNNILTIVLNGADAIRDDPSSSAGTLEWSGYIMSAAERARELVKRLLSFSRQQPLLKVAIETGDFLRRHVEILRRTLGDDVEVKLEIEGDLAPLEADEVQLEQLLMNLAINARDAMPGGGELTIAAETVRVGHEKNFGLEAQPGTYVALRVEDTGCGMDQATQAHIFEPFFSTKETGKGSGLGLASAYGIAKQHGGWITVLSAPGEGSIFTAYLPASKCRPAAVSNEGVAPAGSSFDGKTVLLVEDDPQVRMVSRMLLRRRGCQVLEACSAVEAEPVWRAHASEIELLVTDMMMPGGINGRELAEKLLAEKPDLRVICVTGFSPEAPGLKSLRDSRIVLLPKPFGPIELAAAVDTLASR